MNYKLPKPFAEILPLRLGVKGSLAKNIWLVIRNMEQIHPTLTILDIDHNINQ